MGALDEALLSNAFAYIRKCTEARARGALPPPANLLCSNARLSSSTNVGRAAAGALTLL